MKNLVLAVLPLALSLSACVPMEDEPYEPSGYPPAPYPEPYPPYPQPSPYPEPYPPYPQPSPYPEPYPPQPYPPQSYPVPPVAGLPAPPLDRTRWRVLAINNRPVPPSDDYFVEFDAGRLSAKFGCNGIGAGYTQTGSTLDAGAIIATKMACPDMSWETQGVAILDQVMQVNALGPHRITLSSRAGTIELQRR